MTEAYDDKAKTCKAPTKRRQTASKAVASKGSAQGRQVATMDGSAAVSQMIEVIERVAMNPDVDVIKMEKLLDMQERILDRQAQQEFDIAMANMQPELPVVKKGGVIMNKDGQTVRSTYAKFEDINKAVKPILCDHGFSVTFRISQEGNNISVTANLAHKAGHRESTSMTLPPDGGGGKSDAQAVASATSYAKRYTMSALLNLIFEDEDDDAQPALVSQTQEAALQRLFDPLAANIKKWIMEQYGSLSQVPARDYEWLAAEMKAKAKKKPGKSSRAEAIVEGQVIDHE